MKIILLCILIILVIAVIVLLIVKCFKNFNSKNLILEPIPKVIHKVIIENSGNLPKFPLEPKELQDAHDSWKKNNPEYKIKYYSMNDCREYLKKNFEDSDFLQAFDCLNGYSKKCNFFRYCVLYNEGGWYSDWKQVCLEKNLLDKLNNDNKETDIILSWDRGNIISTKNKYIQNSFIGAIKNNIFLKECINEIINNIKYKYYGETPLDESGPGLLGNMYKFYYNKFKINLIHSDRHYFYNNKKIILTKCNNCGYGQNWKNGNNYNILWKEKKLYNDFIIKDIIPKIIHKTGPQKFNNLSNNLKEIFNNIESNNPGYKIKYYDDNDCYNLIKNNFDNEVLWAYNMLIPTAYKADLFRYCILYLYGGIYSDLIQDILPLDNIIDFNKDTLILFNDRPVYYKYSGIQISFIMSIKKNIIFKKCIDKIVNNCKILYKGNNPLEVTGPYLFKKILNKTNINYNIIGYQSNNNTLNLNNNITIVNSLRKLRPFNKNKYYWHQWIENDIYNIKNIYIPKVIYKTGPFKKNKLPNEIKELFKKIILLNPDYKIEYYDDNECYNLIKNNFDNEVLWAYNTLKPTAYKADLFRYCILYLYGGIYSDLTQDILVSLNKLIYDNNNNLLLCDDHDWGKTRGGKGIQISFIITQPKNEILKLMINKIIINCKNNYYGISPLSVTGPHMFKNLLEENKLLYKIIGYCDGDFIKCKKTNINLIKKYGINNHYSILYDKNKERIHYGTLWKNKNIYNNNFLINYVNNRSLSEICDVKPGEIVSDTYYFNKKNYNNIKNNDKVFVVGTTFKKFKNLLDNIEVKNLGIILSASDIGFPLEQGYNDNINYLDYVNNSNKIKYIFTTNYDLNYESDKIFPIPLGMDYHTLNEKSTSWGNKKSPIYQEHDLLNIYNNSLKFEHRKNKIYSFFHLNVNPKKGREHTKDRFNAKYYLNFNPLNIYQKYAMNRNDTWKEMSKYKWIASPHGNGLDCHRTYEAIALGCIPIVKTSVLDYLYRDMPVIICKDWNELNIDFLNNKSKEALTKSKNTITLNYWINKIIQKNNDI